MGGKGLVCVFASTASNGVKSLTFHKAVAFPIARTGSERLGVNGWTEGMIEEEDGEEYKEY